MLVRANVAPVGLLSAPTVRVVTVNAPMSPVIVLTVSTRLLPEFDHAAVVPVGNPPANACSNLAASGNVTPDAGVIVNVTLPPWFTVATDRVSAPAPLGVLAGLDIV
jgi:hypothetical protein